MANVPFDTLNPRLRDIAVKAVAFCRTKYGGNGLKTEEEIATSIAWRPTFYFKLTRFLIVAVEVEDNLYPEALKIAAHDISHFDSPISVFQACSLEAYLNDRHQAKVNLLRKHGFGIITVDDDGTATIQHPCIPIVQNISSEELEMQMRELTPKLKVKFRNAHVTYLTNAVQGLQQAGQIVEALVNSIADQAAKKGVIQRTILKKGLAYIIDALYQTQDFSPHRAALGGARDFVKEFRNDASHAPKNAKEAAETIKRCKTGFTDAISVSSKLRTTMQTMGYIVKVVST